jgi:hypothetical protein
VTNPVIQRPPTLLSKLLISESSLRITLSGLSYAAGRETLCYWLGTEIVAGDAAVAAMVTTVAFPHVESSYGHFRLVEGQMGLITSWCAEQRLWILAQVHTHPTDEPHSEADECWPASQRVGFLSIVFPYFASLSSVRNPAWRVYESQGNGVWEEVDAHLKLSIVSDVWISPSASRK